MLLPEHGREIIQSHGSLPITPATGAQKPARIQCSTRGSQVIPQPSTNRAQPRLTSEF